MQVLRFCAQATNRHHSAHARVNAICCYSGIKVGIETQCKGTAVFKMHVHVQNEWFLIKFKEIRLKTGWKREGGLPCAHGPVRRVTTKHHKLHKQVMCCFYPNTLFYTLNTFFFC